MPIGLGMACFFLDVRARAGTNRPRRTSRYANFRSCGHATKMLRPCIKSGPTDAELRSGHGPPTPGSTNQAATPARIDLGPPGTHHSTHMDSQTASGSSRALSLRLIVATSPDASHGVCRQAACRRAMRPQAMRGTSTPQVTRSARRADIGGDTMSTTPTAAATAKPRSRGSSSRTPAASTRPSWSSGFRSRRTSTSLPSA